MTPLDIQLLLTALVSVLVLVALIVSRLKMHPLLALLVVSIGVGFATHMEPGSIVHQPSPAKNGVANAIRKAIKVSVSM